jgi:N-acetyl-anhydromuramyl-L-alanine amidase AmpD
MINKIVLHCSASPNGREDTAEDINRWHIERGFDLIGYHYVIEVKGKLVAGRPEYHQGAHASGHNENSLGICLIGTDEFNVDQFAILDNLLRKLKIKYPNVDIIGHNEISDKTCPGFNVQKWLVKIGLK